MNQVVCLTFICLPFECKSMQNFETLTWKLRLASHALIKEHHSVWFALMVFVFRPRIFSAHRKELFQPWNETTAFWIQYKGLLVNFIRILYSLTHNITVASCKKETKKGSGYMFARHAPTVAKATKRTTRRKKNLVPVYHLMPVQKSSNANRVEVAEKAE